MSTALVKSIKAQTEFAVGSTPRAPDRLDSWKEIASYLNRSTRCVQRWERQEGLPIHRHKHSYEATVYAIRGEIDAWCRSRTQGRPVRARKTGGRPTIDFTLSGRLAFWQLGPEHTNWTW